MAVRYAPSEEKFRNVCTVSFPPELKQVLEKWRINMASLADEMGMKKPTLWNKINGTNPGFSPDEYRDLIKVLKQMVSDIEPHLHQYPTMEE
jgi:hypothetical protein